MVASGNDEAAEDDMTGVMCRCVEDSKQAVTELPSQANCQLYNDDDIIARVAVSLGPSLQSAMQWRRSLALGQLCESAHWRITLEFLHPSSSTTSCLVLRARQSSNPVTSRRHPTSLPQP